MNTRAYSGLRCEKPAQGTLLRNDVEIVEAYCDAGEDVGEPLNVEPPFGDIDHVVLKTSIALEVDILEFEVCESCNAGRSLIRIVADVPARDRDAYIAAIPKTSFRFAYAAQLSIRASALSRPSNPGPAKHESPGSSRRISS